MKDKCRPVRCIQERLRCSFVSRWQTSCLCIKKPHWGRVTVFKERERESCWVLSLPLKDFITTCMAIQWLFVHWIPEGEGECHSQCTFQSFTSASTWKQGRQRRHPCTYVYWRNPCRYRKYSRLPKYNCRWHDFWSTDASCHKWMAWWKLDNEKG